MTPFVVCLVEEAQRAPVAGDRGLAGAGSAGQPKQTAPDADATTFTEYQETHWMAVARAWIGLGRRANQVEYFEKAPSLLAVSTRSAASWRCG